jgi:hypothetical protein
MGTVRKRELEDYFRGVWRFGSGGAEENVCGCKESIGNNRKLLRGSVQTVLAG